MRYKVAYGGRGGTKSWGMARALLLKALQGPLRVLCARELQNSISESVHKLLESQIIKMGLSQFFQVLTTEIRCTLTGAVFHFAGIRNNTDKIKSYEDFDICWVEEANKVTKTSWTVLTPTFRKPGSEIWISFNPELETDYTYSHFVKTPRKQSVVVHMTWRDNPWFSDVLKAEMEEMRDTDYPNYLWVWEGQCRTMLEGAVYAKELAAARLSNRVTKVPYDPSLPVDVFFDLGHRDRTSIWFRQYGAFQYRYINFYENSQHHIDHYLQTMQKMGYTYGTVWLPHDAKAKTIGTKLSVEEQVRAKGFKVRIVPSLSIADGINAARTIFGQSYFDEENCEAGLQCLMHYSYEKDKNTGALSENPFHDPVYSHGADAFRYSAIGVKRTSNVKDEHGVSEVTKKAMSGLRVAAKRAIYNTQSWMGG